MRMKANAMVAERKENMDRMEMVEKLREKTGISYEEARQTLEDSGWDLLQAMVNLENKGKLGKNDGQQKERKMGSTQARNGSAKAEGLMHKLVSWMISAIDAGNKNQFVVSKEGREVLSIPVTVALLLFLILNGLFVFVLLVSLALGYRFTYRGRKENEAFRRDVQEADAAAEQINHHHQVNSFGEGI